MYGLSRRQQGFKSPWGRHISKAVRESGPPLIIEKPPIAALHQKVQILAYSYIRVDLELFSRLALEGF